MLEFDLQFVSFLLKLLHDCVDFVDLGLVLQSGPLELRNLLFQFIDLLLGQVLFLFQLLA